MEVEYVEDLTTDVNVNNNSLSENEQLVDIANEIAQMTRINQHDKLQLSDNNDDLFNDESLEQYASGLIDQINNSNEIVYLINNQRRAKLLLRVVEPKKLLFNDNDELDV